MKKKAAESHKILVEVYGDHALAERTCQKWFARFKSGNFDLEDEERSGGPRKFEDGELEAILDEDPSQNQKALAHTLGVAQPTISLRLKSMGMNRTEGGAAEKPKATAAKQKATKPSKTAAAKPKTPKPKKAAAPAKKAATPKKAAAPKTAAAPKKAAAAKK